MLERAARCLRNVPNFTGLDFRNTSHDRRSLHSTFWHHGAGDLDLPTWCYHTVKALFEREYHTYGDDRLANRPRDSRRPIACQTIMLDFLYPLHAQNLLTRLSVLDAGIWQWRMRKWTLDMNFRHFASSAWSFKQFAGNDDHYTKTPSSPAVSEERGEGVETAIPGQLQKDALRILESLISTSERGEYTGSWKEAWDLFGRLDDRAKTPQLVRRIISFLASSTRSLDLRRAFRLFTTLPLAEKNASLFMSVIQALLKLEDFGRAVYLHDQAVSVGFEISASKSTRVLLGHLVAHSQWQLAFHVFETSMASFGFNGDNSQLWSQELFRTLSEMPRITTRVMTLLATAAEYPSMLDAEETPFRKSFVRRLTTAVLERGDGFGAKQNIQVVRVFKTLGMNNRNLCEEAIMSTLGSENTTMIDRIDHALRIFSMYQAETFFRPAKRVLHTLLDQAVKCDEHVAVARLVPEWQRFYGSIPKSLTGLLMQGQARLGNVSAVNKYLSDYLEMQGDPDLRLLYPLLHVHALRADPASTEQAFVRVKEEFKQELDVTCWNILLHAYARAGDLDGTLSTFSRLLDSGLNPDGWTFGTVMAVCAERGDVELCEQLLQTSNNYNIPTSSTMNECHVLACLNDNRISKATVLARTLTVHSRHRVTTRLWNQILIHHALSQRPRNLRATLFTAQSMQKFNIPFDAYTYAGIMRAYVLKRRTDVARGILHKVLRKRDTPVLALHYAIVIEGYANQLKFEKGLRIHAEMLANGVKPTASSRIALQKLHTLAAERKILMDRSSHPGLRIDLVDESLEEALAAHDPMTIADRTPQLSSNRFSIIDRYPAMYFDTSLVFYNKIRAFDTVKTLLERFGTNDVALPLRFMVLLMNLRYHESDHDSVDQYWSLAKSAATKATKIASQSQKTVYLPAIRRTLLSRHLDILLRSLDARNSLEAPKTMLTAINDLFSIGFDLDNNNWNLYIQLLATRGHHSDAFALCERHLMGQFPGWREDEPRARFFLATKQKSPGTEYLGPRYTFLKSGELRATFKTMVRFALVIRNLRRQAPFNAEASRELAELERDSPRTMKAILQMPMKEHPIATHVLGKRAARGMRRQLDA